MSPAYVSTNTSATISSPPILTPPQQIKAGAHFANDLGLDSLDTVEVVMAIEEEFSIEIPDKDADSIHSGSLTQTPSQSWHLTADPLDSQPGRRVHPQPARRSLTASPSSSLVQYRKAETSNP